MKKRTFWIVAAGLVALAMGAAVVGVVAILFGVQSGAWSGQRYLAVHLGGEIPDQAPMEYGPFSPAVRPSLRTIVHSLDRAAKDQDVTSVLLNITPLSDSGWGKVQELRDAIERFNASGKSSYAYLTFAGNKEYYLAAACSQIYASPTAAVFVSGLAAEVTFFRKTFDKIGVEAQFEGVGKYKNAPNQYTESAFTPPHREQMNALLDSLFGQYVDAIAAGRGMTPEDVRTVIDGGPYGAKEALVHGLVDELLYRDELTERLGAGSAERTTVSDYSEAGRGFSFGGGAKVALIYAVGDIVPGRSQSGVFGTSAGADTVAGALEQAAEDDSIRAILLRVDSPGGVGTAADVMWRAASEARKSKPVIVSMGDAAASGGYYLAMAGDAIVAQPGTITGSIGVFSGKFSLRGLYDRVGLTKEILTRGENAGLFTDYRPWSESERARIRTLNEAFYDEFVTKAAAARGVTFEQLDAVAQGRVWTGAEAKEIGLVDRLGGFDVAFALVREKAGLSADTALDVVIVPRPKGFWETLFEQNEEASIASVLPPDVRSALSWVTHLADGVPIARVPYHLVVN